MSKWHSTYRSALWHKKQQANTKCTYALGFKRPFSKSKLLKSSSFPNQKLWCHRGFCHQVGGWMARAHELFRNVLSSKEIKRLNRVIGTFWVFRRKLLALMQLGNSELLWETYMHAQNPHICMYSLWEVFGCKVVGIFFPEKQSPFVCTWTFTVSPVFISFPTHLHM